MNLSLGTIEVYGLPAALEAADAACKSADVTLIGYEATDGLGMVCVKIEGQVSAVQSAIAAARAAAGQVTRVFATSVIPRPSDQLTPVVDTDVTVGRGASPSATPLQSKPAPRPARTAAPEPEAATEPATADQPPTAPEPLVEAAATSAAQTPADGESAEPVAQVELIEQAAPAEPVSAADVAEPAAPAEPAKPTRRGRHTNPPHTAKK